MFFFLSTYPSPVTFSSFSSCLFITFHSSTLSSFLLQDSQASLVNLELLEDQADQE